MIYVLIVDDEPLIRSSVTKKVEEFSASVTVSATACNGADALEWLENNYVDICITDMKMPVMDGLELIKAINQKYPWMVCLIISSYDDFDYAMQGIRLGVLDYILKPVDQKLLNDAMEKACKKLFSGRLGQVHDVLLKKVPYIRKMQEKWVEFIKGGRQELVQGLITDTLKLLKDCAEDKHFLLEAFSVAWLQIIAEEMKKENISIQLNEEYNLQVDMMTVGKGEAMEYFEDCARRRLETGVAELDDSMKSVVSKKRRRSLEQIKGYIRLNYSKSITLQELADQVEMSRTYLSSLFKNVTGMTLWSYIMSVRMEKAADLLKTTSLKVYEVAFQVGYDSNVHFTQVFKEYFGVSPVEYRKATGS